MSNRNGGQVEIACPLSWKRRQREGGRGRQREAKLNERLHYNVTRSLPYLN